MPLRPRLALAELPLHVVQRGNDRRRCFFEDGDFQFYLRALSDAAARYRVLIHAYALMTNHIHLLVTPLAAGGVSSVMQSLGSRYVRRINARRGGVGTLWESRYKACVVERDSHVVAACRYIDLNPVRAGMVDHPRDYRWSSYAGLAGLRVDHVLTPHPALELLGGTGSAGYASWCDRAIDGEQFDELREATKRGTAFGSEAFKARIETLLARNI